MARSGEAEFCHLAKVNSATRTPSQKEMSALGVETDRLDVCSSGLQLWGVILKDG